MKVKDIDALREQISKDPREVFTKHQVWLFASEHNKTVPTVEAIPKDQYENRLKADLEAILVELQLEIEEMSGLCTEIHGDEWNEINTVHSQDVLSLIQDKINKLKEQT